MRKKLALLLCAFPILLSACSAKSPAQPPLTFRTALLQAGGCTFTAAITADYGETAASFTLDCAFSPETGASVTVTEPESIAGIQAQVKNTAASVSYDGMQLGLGSLANGNLAPLAAPMCWGSAGQGSTLTRPERRTVFCGRPTGWATRKRNLSLTHGFRRSRLHLSARRSALKGGWSCAQIFLHFQCASRRN